MESLRREPSAPEARWPMAGAIVAAIVLTVLMPDYIRLGPEWVLPSIEALLLIAVVAADPGSITRRSRELRLLSIGLVSAGMTDEAALAAVLLYRIATYYLPPLWGFFAMVWLRRNRYL